MQYLISYELCETPFCQINQIEPHQIFQQGHLWRSALTFFQLHIIWSNKTLKATEIHICFDLKSIININTNGTLYYRECGKINVLFM